MKEKLRNKKPLIFVIGGGVLAVVILALLLHNASITDIVTSTHPVNEEDYSTVTTMQGDDDDVIHIELPEDYWEQTAIEARKYAESITGNIIAEIDSQTQPPGILPETTVLVEKGGYDIIVRGALIHGTTGLTVYDERGAIVGTSPPFRMDTEYRIINVPRGKYRIVIEKFDDPEINVDCLMKIMLEMTTPEIKLPNLIAKTQVSISNPYDAEMIFESNGKGVTISANGSTSVTLLEGKNDVFYYLKDGDNVSAQIPDSIVVDTTPPVIKLQNTFERRGYVAFNMTVDEIVVYIKVNGEEIPYGGEPFSDGSYPFAYDVEAGVNSIIVEACDRAGNVTKTTLHR